MEGNGCTQNQVGSLKPWNQPEWSIYEWNKGMRNIKKMSCFDNDEARSLLILPSVKKGSLIYLANHPTDSQKDDRTLISILKDLPPTKPYCVKTFDYEYSDEYVKVNHWPVASFFGTTGLDGKVSRIGVWNPKQ